jgi:hypothetical protein
MRCCSICKGWDDHAPPHFHAIYSEHEALFDIRTLDVIGGQLPRRALVLVLEWVQEHRTELLENWELCAHKQSQSHRLPDHAAVPLAGGSG